MLTFFAVAAEAAAKPGGDYHNFKLITPEVLKTFDGATFQPMDAAACEEAFAADVVKQEEKYGDGGKPFADPSAGMEYIYNITKNCATEPDEEGKNQACMGYDKKVSSHIPIYVGGGDTPAIFVDHPSKGDDDEGMAHYIERIYVQPPNVEGVICWEFNGTAGSINAITSDLPLTCASANSKGYTLYAYCNLHGLWTNKPDQPFGDTCAAGIDVFNLDRATEGEEEDASDASAAILTAAAAGIIAAIV